MKHKSIFRTLLAAALLVQAAFLSAQDFQGTATYHSATKMNIKLKSPLGDDALTEDLKKQLNKQMQKEYTLNFTLSESTWKENESLSGGGMASASSGGVTTQVITMGGGNKGILYKNTAEARFEQEQDVFGKPFLVKDELQKYDWQLTGETKKIGNYNCQQAVYEKITTRKSFKMISSSVNDDETSENDMEEVQDTIKVTAWFTPEIPVSHGPENYWGLPGLILELNNGSTTMVCSKVVLNPKEGVELKMPSKGKEVSREEFRKIQEAKVEEMMKKYSGGGGGTFRISTGGGQ